MLTTLMMLASPMSYCEPGLTVYTSCYALLINFNFVFYASQLQPLVARIQCGDLLFAMRCLLEDRLLPHDEKLQQLTQLPTLHQRSVYRQLLFLRCALYPHSFDIGE